MSLVRKVKVKLAERKATKPERLRRRAEAKTYRIEMRRRHESGGGGGGGGG